jgi:hypothetical protein
MNVEVKLFNRVMKSKAVENFGKTPSVSNLICKTNLKDMIFPIGIYELKQDTSLCKYITS